MKLNKLDFFQATMTGPGVLGHVVLGILCVLDRTNMCSIPLATVAASRYVFNLSCIIVHNLQYGQL